MPAMIGGFGNFLLPLLVGGPDMAKQRDPNIKAYTHNLNCKINSKEFNNNGIGNNNKKNKKNNTVLYNILSVSVIISSIAYLISYGDIFISPLSFTSSFLFTSSIVLLYLDDFRFSRITLLNYIQNFSLVIIPLFTLYYTYSTLDIFTNVVHNVKSDNEINLHGHVSLDKESAKVLGQSINTVGSNIGLGASVAGVSAAIGKSIAKSSLPPVQKAAIVVGGGVMGALIHSGVSQINRANTMQTVEKLPDNVSSKFTDNVNKLLDSTSGSPLEELLIYIIGINSICLTISIILIIQLYIKLHVKDTMHIALLSPSLNKYLGKLIFLNKKVSVVWIWLALLILLIGLTSSLYFSHDIYSNLDRYVEIHRLFRNNK